MQPWQFELLTFAHIVVMIVCAVVSGWSPRFVPRLVTLAFWTFAAFGLALASLWIAFEAQHFSGVRAYRVWIVNGGLGLFAAGLTIWNAMQASRDAGFWSRIRARHADPVRRRAEAEFYAEVLPVFRELCHRNELTLGYDSVEEAYGDPQVVFRGRSVHVRLVRGADGVSVDARAAVSGDWHPFERVLRAVGVAIPPTVGLVTLERAAALVEEYLPALEAGFAQPSLARTQFKLEQLEAEAARRAEG